MERRKLALIKMEEIKEIQMLPVIRQEKTIDTDKKKVEKV